LAVLQYINILGSELKECDLLNFKNAQLKINIRFCGTKQSFLEAHSEILLSVISILGDDAT
jgi:hypothetical protein